MENKRLQMRSRHSGVRLKKAMPLPDSQLRKSTIMREPRSQALPMTDQVIETGQKNQQINTRTRSRVIHREPVIPGIGESFEGVERREIRCISTFRSRNCIEKPQKVPSRPSFV
jgi:hypothetical protein